MQYCRYVCNNRGNVRQGGHYPFQKLMFALFQTASESDMLNAMGGNVLLND